MLVEEINKVLTLRLAKLIKDYEFLSPNLITLLSFSLVVPTFYLIMEGKFPLAGAVLYLSALLDSLDGDLARLRGKTTKEGALLDAVLDRYFDLLTVFALTLKTQDYFFGFLALLGSSLVPYIRAKAESLGKRDLKTFGSRDVRNFLIFLGLILSKPELTLKLLAILSNLSALHRFYRALR